MEPLWRISEKLITISTRLGIIKKITSRIVIFCACYGQTKVISQVVKCLARTILLLLHTAVICITPHCSFSMGIHGGWGLRPNKRKIIFWLLIKLINVSTASQSSFLSIWVRKGIVWMIHGDMTWNFVEDDQELNQTSLTIMVITEFLNLLQYVMVSNGSGWTLNDRPTRLTVTTRY